MDSKSERAEAERVYVEYVKRREEAEKAELMGNQPSTDSPANSASSSSDPEDTYTTDDLDYYYAKSDNRMGPLDGVSPKNPADIYDMYLKNPQLNWYHVIIPNISLPILLENKLIRCIACYCKCRRKKVDRSTDIVSYDKDHYHLLISTDKKVESWKKSLKKRGIRLSHTIFRKIKCADHLCEIFEYISCGDYAENRIIVVKHEKYDHSIFDQGWLHTSHLDCLNVKGEIRSSMLKNCQNQNDVLHDYETCECPNSKNGRLKKTIANKKRSHYHRKSKKTRLNEEFQRLADEHFKNDKDFRCKLNVLVKNFE